MLSAQHERLGELDDALGVRVPALRRMGVVVQIAAHAYEARSRREGKVAAHRRTRHVGMEFGELRAVHEGHAPFLLDMRAAVQHIVGVGVRVPAEPEIDRARARRQILLEGLRLRLVAKKIQVRSPFRRAVGAVISAAAKGPVRIAGHAFIVARSDRRFPQHVVGAGDDDLVARRLDVLLPPFEGLGHDGAGRRCTAVRLAPDGIRQIVAVAHHQEAGVADLERVALPGPVDRVRPPCRLDVSGLCVLAHGIGPFAEPPVRLLPLARRRTMGRGIVIAGDVVDLLAAMMFEDRVLAHDLAPLLVLRGIPESRIVAAIERDIPLDRGAAETPALLGAAWGWVAASGSGWTGGGLKPIGPGWLPALAALSVPTWQSLMTQRLNLAPSRDVVALCAAAATAGVAKPAMPALISIRRVREVGSIDVLLCGWPRGILNAARRRARAREFQAC